MTHRPDVFTLTPTPPPTPRTVRAARRAAAQQVVDGKLTTTELREILDMLGLQEERQP